MVVTLTKRLAVNSNAAAGLTLWLTAEERTRSRHRFEAPEGEVVFLQLPRGTVLRDGDLLQSEADGRIVKIMAKAEPVLTVQATSITDLLQAAYHLGNRHVPLEITATYLRLSTDPVLLEMLKQRGLQVTEEVQPFQPEPGAYGHSHSSSNSLMQ